VSGLARGVLAALGAIAGISPGAAGQDCPDRHAGVTVRVVEEAHDGKHQICAGDLVRVDANSDLVIEFSPPVSPESVETSPESKRLVALLDRVRDLERDVARLNDAPTPTDSAGVVEMQREATAATTRVRQLLASLDSLGWTQAERDTILTGRFPGGTGDPLRAYTNLNLWLDQELRQLRSEAEAFADAKGRLLVQVTAFRDPRGGARSALHVENYDDLPAGELQTIDRYGLDLTPAERAAWESSVALHQSVAAAVREIQENRQLVGERLRDRIRELGERFQRFATMLKSGPETWAAALGGRIKQVETLAADPAAAASKTSLQDLVASLRVLEKDYVSVRTVTDGVTKIAATLRGGGPADLRQLLFQSGGIVDQLTQLDGSVRALVAVAADLPKHLDAVQQRLQELDPVLPADVKPGLLPTEVASVFKDLAAELPAAAAAIQAAVAVLDASRRSVDAQGTLSADAGSVLQRALDDLPEGRVELARAGWIPGDRVLVTVSFVDAPSDAGATAESRARRELSYRGEAVLTGLHRELSSALIFARALHGGDRTWKPNVAALVGWHYYKRNPRSFGGKLWNWLNPGLGLHLASLDQTEDNFEFGVGGNLTVWNGLLSTGFGWNLSRDNGEYVFLAIDLFETLNRVSR
jgi:hypothetical protein